MLVALAGTPLAVRAQHGADEAAIERLEALFSPASLPERYGVEVQVSVYLGRTIAPLSFPVSIRRLGHNWLRTTKEVTYLSTPEATVVVDHSRKTIRYALRALRLPEEGQPGSREGITTMRDKQTRVIEAGESPDGYRIVVENDHTLIRRMEVLLEPRADRLRRVRYEYRSSGANIPDAVVMQFRWLDPLKISVADFSEGRFIRRVDGKVVPSVAFHSFNLVEMRAGDEQLKK